MTQAITPEKPQYWKDPKRILLVLAALTPFIVATLYMSLKPAPKRLERTHPPGIQDHYKKEAQGQPDAPGQADAPGQPQPAAP